MKSNNLTYLLATIIVLELPPKLSFSSHVSTESLYGMNSGFLLAGIPPIGLSGADEQSAI